MSPFETRAPDSVFEARQKRKMVIRLDRAVTRHIDPLEVIQGRGIDDALVKTPDRAVTRVA